MDLRPSEEAGFLGATAPKRGRGGVPHLFSPKSPKGWRAPNTRTLHDQSECALYLDDSRAGRMGRITSFHTLCASKYQPGVCRLFCIVRCCPYEHLLTPAVLYRSAFPLLTFVPCYRAPCHTSGSIARAVRYFQLDPARAA